MVGVDVRPNGSLSALEAAVRSLGMTIESTDTATQTIEGLIPIAQLLNLASLPEVSSITPIIRPSLNITGAGFIR